MHRDAALLQGFLPINENTADLPIMKKAAQDETYPAIRGNETRIVFPDFLTNTLNRLPRSDNVGPALKWNRLLNEIIPNRVNYCHESAPVPGAVLTKFPTMFFTAEGQNRQKSVNILNYFKLIKYHTQLGKN